MEDIIVRCFPGEGEPVHFCLQVTEHSTQLIEAIVRNLWAIVTTKSRVKLVSCAAVFKVGQIAGLGPSSSLCPVFHGAGFIHKLYLGDLGSLGSQHQNPKPGRRESALFGKHREKSSNWVPVGPMRIPEWITSDKEKEYSLAKRRLKAAHKTKSEERRKPK